MKCGNDNIHKLSDKIKDEAYEFYLKYTFGPKVSKLVFEANWEFIQSNPFYQAYLTILLK